MQRRKSGIVCRPIPSHLVPGASGKDVVPWPLDEEPAFPDPYNNMGGGGLVQQVITVSCHQASDIIVFAKPGFKLFRGGRYAGMG